MEGWGRKKCKTNVYRLLVGLSSSSLVKMCLCRLLSRRLRQVTSVVTFSVQRRLKPSHHIMICQLLPRFRAPRYRSIKMHVRLSIKNQSNTSSFIRNRLMQGSTRKAPPRSFGAHGTLDAVNRNICAKLGQNGIHVCLQPVSFLEFL